MSSEHEASRLLHVAISASLGAGAFLLGWLNHSAEYVSFWIVFGGCCARMTLPAILPRRWPAIWFALDLAILCIGFIVGFWLGRNRWMYGHAVVQWTVLLWTGLVVFGTPLAWGLNRWAQRRLITGPYCRGCRYHLRGVTNWRCPECGRPFTLKELGVAMSELRADG